jgi:hypothetical protein
MDREHPERGDQCDHDDDVMCTSRFFDKTLRAHLDRQRLCAIMDNKQHWVFAITPECTSVFLRLQQLHRERGAMRDVDVLTLPGLPMTPIFVCVPRDQLSLEDLGDVLDFNNGSRELYESMAFITVTTLDPKLLGEVASQWVHVDHLLN